MNYAEIDHVKQQMSATIGLVVDSFDRSFYEAVKKFRDCEISFWTVQLF